MQLTIDHLRQIGAFVEGPVEKSITWTQRNEAGEVQEFTATTHIRRASCATFEREIRAVHDKREMVATRIASSVCNPDGSQLFDYDQALALTDTLAAALFRAIVEVNPGAPKTSAPPMKSGASSS